MEAEVEEERQAIMEALHEGLMNAWDWAVVEDRLSASAASSPAPRSRVLLANRRTIPARAGMRGEETDPFARDHWLLRSHL